MTHSRWRAAKREHVTGELRMKAWRAILHPATAQDDPTWTARCKQYWERQERIFGVRMSDFTMVIDDVEGVVCTYAVVVEVLPGERVADPSFMPDTVIAYDKTRGLVP